MKNRSRLREVRPVRFGAPLAIDRVTFVTTMSGGARETRTADVNKG